MPEPTTTDDAVTPDTAADPVLTDYQQSIADYWNNKTSDQVNLALGDVDGYYHHHYGLGPYDPAVLDGLEEGRDQRIIDELHRLETAQADVLLDALGAIGPGDRLMDGGSGRGGTSFMANERFGCRVDGVTISEYQVGFARQQAIQRDRVNQVWFHLCNMLDTRFPPGTFRGIWNNETTMYVDLFDLYREFARLLEHGGRYVCITGCYNDVLGPPSPAVRAIDDHYLCKIHPRTNYFEALAANGLTPISVVDLTPQAIPYWELRARSSVRTGIEEPFLTAFRDGSFHYLLIAADRT